MRRLIVRHLIGPAVACAALACRTGEAPPAALDTAHDACGYCRMVISDARFASQIVAPREEPTFFDDLGCLRKYLESAPPIAADARLYVADHRTKAWVSARQAVYGQASVTAPMGSPFLAWETPASRAADPDGATAAPVDAAVVFGRLAAEMVR